jgi:hypothetical protein
MQSRTAPRLTASLIAFGLLVTGCGLKPDALRSLKQAGANGQLANGEGTLPGAVDASGNPIAQGTGGPGAPGTTGGLPGTTGGGGTGGGGTGGGGTGGGGTGGGGTGGGPDLTRAPCSTPTGGNTTGITSTTIRIGAHAPQTGTGAPLPPSFKDGIQAYWDLKSHYICGRHVIVDFQDDTYTPAGAKAVCGPMSRRDFVVFGAAGTDQIQACATMPDIVDHNVPYLSGGVTSNGLTKLSSYFALSLTYEQQGALVVRNAIAQGFAHPKTAGGKWAIVTGQSGNFDDATRGAQNALRAAGIPFDTFRVNQSDDGLQQRAVATGDQLSQAGYGVVYQVTSPGYFVYEVGKANKNPATGFSTPTYNPMYTGPGTTMTEVTVAQLVCSNATNQTVRANFLAPFPGLDKATADFKAATNNSYDDIWWALWGSAQLIEQMLNAANRNLTRENFLATLAGTKFPAGVFAPVHYPGPVNPGTHFGGTGAFSQKLDCSQTEPNQQGKGAGTWTTVGGRIDL